MWALPTVPDLSVSRTLPLTSTNREHLLFPPPQVPPPCLGVGNRFSLPVVWVGYPPQVNALPYPPVPGLVPLSLSPPWSVCCLPSPKKNPFLRCSLSQSPLCLILPRFETIRVRPPTSSFVFPFGQVSFSPFPAFVGFIPSFISALRSYLTLFSPDDPLISIFFFFPFFFL